MPSIATLEINTDKLADTVWDKIRQENIELSITGSLNPNINKTQLAKELHKNGKWVTDYIFENPNLSKDISDYCYKHKKGRYAYSGVRNSIYLPIKYVLNLRRIDDITEEQVPVAKRIFDFIASEKMIQEIKYSPAREEHK